MILLTRTLITNHLRNINLLKCIRPLSTEDNELRGKILEAALPHVKQYGWSKEAIAEGAKSLGYSGVVHGIFQDDGADLVLYFQENSNSQLTSKLQSECTNAKEPREVVEGAIKTRLQMIVPYLEHWPSALGILSHPQNLPKALNHFSTLIDDICYYSGDRSVDINWYVRRFAVGAIYKSSELCLIQDNSPDLDETWSFLKRRLDEAWKINQCLPNETVVSQILASSASTVKNLLGLKK